LLFITQGQLVTALTLTFTSFFNETNGLKDITMYLYLICEDYYL